MTKKKKRIVVSLSIITIIIALAVIFSPKKDNLITLEKTKVDNENISTLITATGTVKPINQVEVGTQVSGIIKKLYVDFNSIVKKGQLLAEIDKEMLDNELKAMQSNLDAAKIEFDYQKLNYNRQKELHTKQLISDSEFEQAKYTYDKSKTNYEMSQSNLTKIKTNLAYATIYSPIDGVVLKRAVEEGQTVAASFNTPTLFTIAQDLSKMQIVASVDEADIGEVREGQKVDFSVDAYPDEIFVGSVQQVRLNATTTTNVVTYEVIIDAPNENLKLKPGLTASVNIYTNEKKDVLGIPYKALSFKPETKELGKKWTIIQPKDKKMKYVWITKGDTLITKVIQIGINNGSRAEVIGGLKKGEEIVIGIEDNTIVKKKGGMFSGGN
ncbi:MAG: efflux RND transporter periplasmic adaptor subunit [Bacteroidales bacterium]|nr:efflux RND transporter periplasmic adaptor subunit [Bacteroidales bacterium]MDD4684196.1 efflux RND transporter periplasmic adaptor subunit [Bacteroidales bacterium]